MKQSIFNHYQMSSDIVQYHDLKFKRLYSREQIDKQVDRMAHQIDQHFQSILAKDPQAKFVILGILNGAFMFVSQLVRRLRTAVFIEFIKVMSYKGTQKGDVQIISDANKELLDGSYLIVVDDICDTGETLEHLSIQLKSKYNAQEIKFVTLVIRPDKQQVRKPDYYRLTCSKFIVDYGLDYDHLGRQSPEIYQKI